ncbi:MAG: hypothetical protein LBS31_02175, partial [Candidatus Adiutrix sp.]|nr:hypothetical protein [Candidatus Adiutrix sp.]
MKGSASFSPAAIAVLAAAAVGLLAASVLLRAYGPEPAPAVGDDSFGANSFSVSAIGHAGFYDMLRRLGWPVSRRLGGDPLRAAGTFIMAEPKLEHLSEAGGFEPAAAPRLLLVLPKWRGFRNADRRGWVGGATLLSPATVQQTLETALRSCGADLPPSAGSPSPAEAGRRVQVARVPWPLKWATNELGPAPAGSGQIQLLRDSGLRAVAAADEGLLVGELDYDGGVIWVLSDPDVMSNHGLFKGDNAAFMVALLGGLISAADDGGPAAPIVFDEAAHGFRKVQAEPFKLLFSFPFVIVAILLCATAGLLALAAVGRFGAPRRTRPNLDFGKAGLIGNGARLLGYAGHPPLVLRRYVGLTVRTVAQTLHAPSGLNEAALAGWLDQIGRARGVRLSCAEILAFATHIEAEKKHNQARLFQSVRDIHRWKGEILNES